MLQPTRTQFGASEPDPGSALPSLNLPPNAAAFAAKFRDAYERANRRSRESFLNEPHWQRGHWTFTANLNELFARKGLTAEAVSKQTGVPLAQILGAKSLSAGNAFAIADLLGTTLQALSDECGGDA